MVRQLIVREVRSKKNLITKPYLQELILKELGITVGTNRLTRILKVDLGL